MIECKHNLDFFDDKRDVMNQLNGHEEKWSLTKLWEVIVRTKRLPEGVDEAIFFNIVRGRLRDPEREVRQNALRVLSDLIPVTQTSTIDDHMRIVLSDILNNLGHPAPALRKGALDSLRKYLKHTTNANRMLKDLISFKPEEQALLASTPYLISSSTSDDTLKFIVDQLWRWITNQGSSDQENAVKTMTAVRYRLGDEKFNSLLELDKIKDLYKLQEAYGFGVSSKGDKTGNKEDKIILETEITLKNGPPIMMKVHEESRSSTEITSDEREDMGVVRVLPPDNLEDTYYESARRTPRKVRFGGEIVKLRTPESDENNGDLKDTSIHIMVTNAVAVKTKKSLIPIRITSLPSTPKKKITNSKKFSKSTPNLSTKNSSKIPLRRRAENRRSLKEQSKRGKTTAEGDSTKLILPPHCTARNDGIISPVFPHKVIETFHNLTRSPDRLSGNNEPPYKPATTIIQMAKMETEDMLKKYNTFQMYDEQPLDKQDKINNNKLDENQPKDEPTLTLPPIDQKEDLTHNEEQRKEVIEEFHKVQTNNHQLLSLPSVLPSKNESPASAASPIPPPSPTTSKPSGTPLNQLVSLTQEDSWSKADTLESLNKMLRDPKLCDSLEPGQAALLFEALFRCYYKDRFNSLANEAITVLVERLNPKTLESCLRYISIGFCRMGAPNGVKLSLKLMQKLDPRKVQIEIIEEAFGHRTREGALQILVASARLLPSDQIEVKRIAEFASCALRDRRRRIRHAALELLATLAQIGSANDVIDVVQDVVGSPVDNAYLLQVVRTRLSRKQLPSVELDGTIRYSSPKEHYEMEWLSGVNSAMNYPGKNERCSASSTASSSTSFQTVNYWKHNSRHDDGHWQDAAMQPFQQNLMNDSANNNTHGNQQSSWQGVTYSKNSSNPNKGLPETDQQQGKYFPGQKKSFHPNAHYGQMGSAPHNLQSVNPTKQHHHFRKSFSSEHLYTDNAYHSSNFHYGSSRTLSNDSERGGMRHQDYYSGIPVPVSSEHHLRLRPNQTEGGSFQHHARSNYARRDKVADISCARANESTPVVAITLPPEPLFKTNFSTSQDSPVICRITPQMAENHIQILPPSSGSESSGYFTPPPEAQHAFVKLDTEDHSSDEVPDLKRQDSVESIANNRMFLSDDSQNIYFNSSMDNSEEEEITSIPCRDQVDHDFQEEVISFKQSVCNLDKPDLSKVLQSRNDLSKSKSMQDLKNFLPEIGTVRKNINSAPPFNESNIVVCNDFTTILPGRPLSTKVVLPEATKEVPDEEIQEVKPSAVECTKSGRVVKRFGRSLSKRSHRNPAESTSESGGSREVCRPKESLTHLLCQMDSPEWETMVLGLKGLTKLIELHPEVVETYIHAVCSSLAKHVKNLRSQVARAACITASMLFATCKKGLDKELEEVVVPLLQRSADTNRFLRADANGALDVMCEQLPPGRVVQVITTRGCCHQNAVVRATSMRLLNKLVTNYGPEKIMLFPKETRDRILLSGANALTDGSLDARKQAKAMLGYLMCHHHFQKALLEAVPQQIMRHIAKTLSSLKGSSIT